MRNKMLDKQDSGLRIGVVNRSEDYVMKFSLYLHWLRHRSAFINHQICVDDVKTAIQVQKYYLAQIDRLTHRQTNELEVIGVKIWEWLTKDEGRLNKAKSEGIKVREISRSLLCRYSPTTKKFGRLMTKNELIEDAINHLVGDNRPVGLVQRGKAMVVQVSK